jgi:hypothetical protein
MMRNWIHTACLSAGLLAMSTGYANALPTTFELADHPDGALVNSGDYGLRLDSLGVGGNPNTVLFSVEIGGADVDLTFDPDDLGAGASLIGTIEVTYASGLGSPPVGEVATVAYYMRGLAPSGDGGFVAEYGKGVVTYGDFALYFTGKTKAGTANAFTFAPDDHRLGGHGYPADTWVGRGWLDNFNLCYEPSGAGLPSSTLSGGQGGCQGLTTRGSNDFLVTAPGSGDIPEVPEPSTLLLTMGGAAMLWLRKRRS